MKPICRLCACGWLQATLLASVSCERSPASIGKRLCRCEMSVFALAEVVVVEWAAFDRRNNSCGPPSRQREFGSKHHGKHVSVGAVDLTVHETDLIIGELVRFNAERSLLLEQTPEIGQQILGWNVRTHPLIMKEFCAFEKGRCTPLNSTNMINQDYACGLVGVSSS